MTAATGHAALAADGVVIAETAVRLHAGGTMWRLRSLGAMGHDASRIARALRVHPKTIQKLLRGEAETVSPELRELSCQLWDAWWDKRPPERTRDERRAAATARRRAKRHGWCTPLGLEEDKLDELGYRPYSRYRAATGTGLAEEFRPVVSTRPDQRAAWAHGELAGSAQEPREARNLVHAPPGNDRWSVGNHVMFTGESFSLAVTATCGTAAPDACAHSPEPST